MKTRTISFLVAIVLSALLVMGFGAYLKYDILQPYGIAQDLNVLELPFLLATDEALQYEIRLVMEPGTHPVDPDPTPPAEDPADPTADPTQDPSTVPTTEPVRNPTEGTEQKHTYVDTVYPATCTERGYTLHACSVCGDSYQDTWTEMVPHSYTSVVVEPRPESQGYTEYTCTVCGHSYRDNYVDYVVPDSYPGYDFSAGAVDDSWYDDVLFIGDSRTLGLREYHRSGNADYFCAVGMSVFNVQTNRCGDVRFEKQTLESLLASKSYGKIFINLGINECGYPTSSLVSAFQDLISLIKKYQPDAKIVIQLIMTVSKSYSGASYFQPDHIFALNDRLQTLCDGTTVYAIDVNPYFTDSQGYLYRELTSDGCHLLASYYAVWAQWISFAVGELGI